MEMVQGRSQWYEVLADFSAQDENELSVRAGEAVVSRRGGEDGWILVSRPVLSMVDDDESGYVPTSYIKISPSVASSSGAAPSPGGPKNREVHRMSGASVFRRRRSSTRAVLGFRDRRASADGELCGVTRRQKSIRVLFRDELQQIIVFGLSRTRDREKNVRGAKNLPRKKFSTSRTA